MRPSREQLVRLAASHWAVGAGEAPDARLALGWYARNLAERVGLPPADCCARMLCLAAGSGLAEGLFEGAACRRGIADSLELLRAVWAGEHLDPTGGAVRAHRHEESPLWADGAWPTTLIGPWIFYRAP